MVESAVRSAGRIATWSLRRAGPVIVMAVLALGPSCEKGDRTSQMPTEGPKTSAQLEPHLKELKRRMLEEPPARRLQTADEYRKIVGDDPDGLRMVARAYYFAGAHERSVELLRELVRRGQATLDDRLEILEILRYHIHFREWIRKPFRGPIDDPTYREGLAWIEEKLARKPECQPLDLLVDWTLGHTEHASSIERGLAGCRRESKRGRWLALRSKLKGDSGGDDACDAIVNDGGGQDRETLAETCIRNGKSRWKVGVAKALLGQQREANLRAAWEEPDVTVFVLKQLVRTPEVARHEACEALVQARGVERGWEPGLEIAVDSLYAASLDEKCR